VGILQELPFDESREASCNVTTINLSRRISAIKEPSRRLSATKKLLRRIWNIGEALAPIAPESSLIWSQMVVSQSSFCSMTLSGILSVWPYGDSASVFFKQLLSLPDELLQIIISHVREDCALRNAFILFGDSSRILAKLEHDHARISPVASGDAIFATHIRIGNITYITGLYNNEVESCTLLKAATVRFRFAVIWLNNIGVTRMEFHSSLESLTPWKSHHEWLYVIDLTDKIQTHSKVYHV
jgi:hypothetical protein